MNDFARLGIEIDSSSAARAAVDLDKLPGAAQRAERGVEGVGRKATVMGGAVDRATASVRGMFGAFAAGAAAAFSLNAITRTLAGFEQSMAAVQAITRANATEMAALRDIAKELGATTEFSASQAADGLKFLGMAGFTATESVSAIPSVLNLATAAAMDLASAADITSNIMSGFGIQAENASAVADVLAAASSRANTNVQQLGGAMSTVAPIAAALDIGLSDTAAAIGVLSDAGIQGERAGTAMRGVLAALAGPTTAAQKVLQRLGLTVRDVNPATNDLATIMDRLGGAGLTTADAMTIFGREAASGALVLVQAAERVREFGGELSNVTGEAQRMADTMRDNLGGDIQGLMSSVEAMIIALGESGLTAALRLVTQVATEAFRFLAENMDRVLYYAGAVATFFAGPYVAAFVAARIQTFNLVAALTALRTALIRTGVGALVVLAGELVYQFVQLVERAGGFGNAMRQMGQVAQDVMERIKNGARAMDYALRGVAYSVEAAFRTAWGNILVGFENMMSSITGRAPETYGMTHTPGQAQIIEGNRASVQSRNMYDRAAEYWDMAMNGSGEQNVPGTPGSRGRPSRSGASGAGGSGGLGGGGGGGGGSASEQLNAYQEATKAIREQTKALQDQQLTFGLSEQAASTFAKAMELLRAAEEAKIPITSDLINEINGLAQAYALAEQNANTLREQQQLLDQATSKIANSFTDMFEAAISGGKNLMEIIGSLIADLGRMFLNQGFQALLGGALGGFNPLGFLFGGFRANGGPVQGGVPYVVGERGPEMFVPRQSGTIVPNHAMGGAANQNMKVDITVKVDGARGNTEIQQMVSQGVAQGLKTVERNFGGMLADHQMRY